MPDQPAYWDASKAWGIPDAAAVPVPDAGDDTLREQGRLAAALSLAIHDAHPTYANTTGWRGGIGGQAITPGCSFIDPPPGDDWTQFDLLSTPLREWLTTHPDFDLDAAKAALRDELLGQLEVDRGRD